MVETTDYTPRDLDLTRYRRPITPKRQVLDRLVYPLSTRLVYHLKAAAHPELAAFSFDADRVLWGDRGSGFLASILRLKRFMPTRGGSVLVQGCGLGQEVLAWSKLGAASCCGMDLFNFRAAWNEIASKGGATVIDFRQGDICKSDLPSHSFDIVSSSAVWEHVTEFDLLVAETHRLLKPGGLAFASFGPLWHTFSGDHFSAKGGFECGFNHLLLERKAYLEWIDSFKSSSELAVSREDYFEIRRHLHEGLFSYLRPREYIEKVEKRFQRVHTTVVLNPPALAFKTRFPEKWSQLLDRDLAEEDLLIKSLRLILAPIDR